MSSINGYESSKLQFHDEPYDDDPAEPSAFVIPRPQVTGQYEMQRTNSDERLVQQDDTAAKVTDLLLLFLKCYMSEQKCSKINERHVPPYITIFHETK